MIRSAKAPATVTRLGTFVLIFTGWHIYRLVSIGQEWAVLQDLSLSISPIFLALQASLWTLLGMLALWSLIFKREFFQNLMAANLLIYAISIFAKALILRSGGLPSSKLWFELGMTLFTAIIIFWTLTRESAKHYFGERYDRQEN